jgi:hypothetical protein
MIIVEIHVTSKFFKYLSNYKNGLEKDRLGKELRSSTSGIDSIDGEEVVRGPSVLTVPLVAQKRIRFYTALVPQRQLWHHLWVITAHLPVSRSQCCKCRSKSWFEWRPELFLRIPVQQYQFDYQTHEKLRDVAVFAVHVFHDRYVTTEPYFTLRSYNTHNKEVTTLLKSVTSWMERHISKIYVSKRILRNILFSLLAVLSSYFLHKDTWFISSRLSVFNKTCTKHGNIKKYRLIKETKVDLRLSWQCRWRSMSSDTRCYTDWKVDINVAGEQAASKFWA